MKLLYSLLAAVMLLGTAVPVVQAAVSVSVDFFHDNLESYGDWREVGEYGYCWQPRDVDRDWRPYSDGRWVYTDAGWTWDSEEPYSWAVYHYGRWARVDRIGWVWIPGTEWGPAWVSWRRSSRHVGWAPLPPNAEFRRSVGFNTRVDVDYDIGPTNYNFVEVRNFGAPRMRTVIIEPRENITIIRQTTNITRITYVNNVIYNEGPQYEVMSRESAQPIRRLKLERREQLDGDPGTVRGEQLRTRIEGDSFRAVALPFDTKPATAPRKVAAKVEKVEVDRGWKNAGPPAEVAKLRAKIKSEPATPAEVPSPPATDKTADAPAVSPGPSPTPDAMPAKGKLRGGGETTAPTATVPTEVAPPSPEKPATPEKAVDPGNPEKGAKPKKSEAGSVRPSPPAVEAAAPSTESKKEKRKGIEAEPPPAEAPRKEQDPGPKPKTKTGESTRTVPPASEATEPSGKSKKDKKKEIEAPQPPAPPSPKAEAPTQKKGRVEPRPALPPAVVEAPREKTRPGNENARPIPEPRQQAVPAATQPQPPPQPAKDKGKGKGKGKDEKKDEAAP